MTSFKTPSCVCIARWETCGPIRCADSSPWGPRRFAVRSSTWPGTITDREGAAAHHHSEAGHSDAPSKPGATGIDEPPETLEAWARFHEAVERLPGEERDAFSLVWYGEATQKEAAELLGVSERTVLRRIVRARLQLHDSLKSNRAAFEERLDRRASC